MYFKVEHILHEIVGCSLIESLEAASTEGRRASIAIRSLMNDEKKAHQGGAYASVAVVEKEPSPEVRVVFERLARNQMFEGFVKPEPGNAEGETYDYIDDRAT